MVMQELSYLFAGFRALISTDFILAFLRQPIVGASLVALVLLFFLRDLFLLVCYTEDTRKRFRDEA